jgi:hypothetical protein
MCVAMASFVFVKNCVPLRDKQPTRTNLFDALQYINEQGVANIALVCQLHCIIPQWQILVNYKCLHFAQCCATTVKFLQLLSHKVTFDALCLALSVALRIIIVYLILL